MSAIVSGVGGEALQGHPRRDIGTALCWTQLVPDVSSQFQPDDNGPTSGHSRRLSAMPVAPLGNRIYETAEHCPAVRGKCERAQLSD